MAPPCLQYRHYQQRNQSQTMFHLRRQFRVTKTAKPTVTSFLCRDGWTKNAVIVSFQKWFHDQKYRLYESIYVGDLERIKSVLEWVWLGSLAFVCR